LETVPLRKLAVSMWDFTWLTRRFGHEAEFADFDRVLDEFCERGYNSLRIDPFPHYLSFLEEDQSRRDEFTVLPQTYSKQWGNSISITTDLRRPLISFLEKCRKRNLRVGLSTWFTPDTMCLRSRVRTPSDYVRVWRSTLRFIQKEGFADIIDWVDLCNEFPFMGWAYGACETIFRTPTWNSLAYFLPWSKKTVGTVQSYIDKTIPELKKEFDFRFTFSCMCLPRKEHLINIKNFDLIEPHLWLTDTLSFGVPSIGLLSTAQFPFANHMHAAAASVLHPVFRKFWRRRLELYMERISSWAHKEGKPLVTTEGWASTMYGGGHLNEKEKVWYWIKDVCHEAVHMAIEKGWTGICTSNFCQPHFPAMWRDVNWHRQLTAEILKDS